jgi:hypothetical protein
MRVQSGVMVGEGLFSPNAVDVEVEFADSVAVFKMRPLTPELMAKLQAEGIKFEGLEQDTARALEVGKRVLSELVESWDNLLDAAGSPVPFTPENRDTLATVPALSKLLWGAATDLASKAVEAEEKN